MSLYRSHQCFCLLFLSAVTWSAPVAQAQLLPDVTLGDESSSISTEQLVQGDLADVIEGGAARGSNLFHSFSEFNINNGQRVYFANPAEIESILSRVTGNNPSEIFGTLGVDGPADLFFINPNGLVFGENAQLDIPGSFYGTTAEAVEIGNAVFSATTPAQSQLLAVSPSVSFWNYLTENSGDIINRGALAVERDLVLAASQLDLENQVAAVGDVLLLATDAIKIRDTAETPFIAFAGEDLLVQGNQQVDIVALSHPDSGLFSYGDMILRSDERIGGDAHYFSGGNFRVENLDGSSGELFSPIDPIIRVYGNVDIQQYFGSSLHILAGGSVRLGAAFVTVPDEGELGLDFLRETIELSDGTLIEIDGGAQATLDVRAGVSPGVIGQLPVEITGLNIATDFLPNLITGDIPTRADIIVNVAGTAVGVSDGLILLTNNYAPNLALPDGDIVITRENVPEPFTIGLLTTSSLDQQSGSIFLDSRNNILITDSTIETTSLGDVGDITLLANDKVIFDGSNSNKIVGVLSNVIPNAQGVGGDIRIQANNLQILNGSQIGSNVFGMGEGGDIILDIRDTIRLEGSHDVLNPLTNNSFRSPSRIATSIVTDGQGIGGDIRINATNLDILNGGRLSNTLLGQGDGGDIILDIEETIRLDGTDSIVFTPNNTILTSSSGISATSNGNGQSGDIQIMARNLAVTNGAEITASIGGAVNPGTISLDIQDGIVLSGSELGSNIPSGIFTNVTNIDPNNSNASRKGGNIRISAGGLNVLEGAQIRSDTFSVGDAGNILLDIRDTVRFEGSNTLGRDSGASSRVRTGAQGQGGELRIIADNLEVLNGAALSVSSFGTGDAGDIILDIRDTVRFQGADPIDGSSSQAVSSIGADANGQGGNIQITARILDVVDGGQLATSSFGVGNSGNIVLEVDETVLVSGINVFNTNTNSGIFTSTDEFSVGQSGDIQISANSLEVLNGAQINSSTGGLGDAGDVLIVARDNVLLQGADLRSGITPSAIFSRVEDSGIGQGGNIRIVSNSQQLLDSGELSVSNAGIGNAGNIVLEANTVDVLNGASLTAQTTGKGNAGNIILEIDGVVRFIGIDSETGFTAQASSSVAPTGEGKGGTINITANALEVLDGAQLNTLIFGIGNAGDVILDIRGPVSFEGSNPINNNPSGAFSSIQPNGQGESGDVRITATNLDVLNGAQVGSTTFGVGDAGDLILTIRETVRLVGNDSSNSRSTGLFSGLQPSSIGTGGDIRLSANNLEIVLASLSSRSAGQGDAGNLILDIRDRIQIQDGTITTNAEFNAGGQIQIDAGIISLFGDSDIQTFVNSGADNGGDITITADAVVALDDSDILAFAADGRGGNVDLSRTAFFGQDFSLAPFGTDPRTLDGNNRVDINATGRLASGNILLPDVSFIQNTLTELPDNLVNPETLVSNSCIARSNDTASSFTLTGSDGLPSNSSQPSYSLSIVQSTNIQPTTEPTDLGQDTPVIEPHRVYQLSDGRLVMSRECNEMN
ncbi:filamentous hemagglutinin N-terminal domain-containing protein [Leptolyngbya cf. ectocarpi LEGE 11479]|uniref:Filamentous hemagglutinin N-terminal domain-containing protein n=1 Tax=Leptolyngbya cf. ectocarpi LEGE 11479 TaxID=1828722 RepID=A0A928ZY70_LEPEC|nr:filamentous hemagglutinin N-terminal domain-containing protein [Leptolyngbya ectocarpi]MBE9069610.1 filamentous hemagglutinin N-terminal domain-containing protein [Leptolyngbya cf. ectocarpi LEGE 11479]